MKAVRGGRSAGCGAECPMHNESGSAGYSDCQPSPTGEGRAFAAGNLFKRNRRRRGSKRREMPAASRPGRPGGGFYRLKAEPCRRDDRSRE